MAILFAMNVSSKEVAPIIAVSATLFGAVNVMRVLNMNVPYKIAIFAMKLTVMVVATPMKMLSRSVAFVVRISVVHAERRSVVKRCQLAADVTVSLSLHC